MREKEVLERAFAMPLTNPAYSPGPYRFVDREYLIITYRTDPVKLRAIVPEPLELNEREPLVKYEFIRMPDSNGFGDYTESGQVIPVTFRGRTGGYTHCMFLNDEGPIAGGRELWGFPKKLAQPTLRTEIDTLVGTLDYGPVRVATGTMGYKHREADQAKVKASLEAPNFLLKIIPHVDGTPRICELRYGSKCEVDSLPGQVRYSLKLGHRPSVGRKAILQTANIHSPAVHDQDMCHYPA
jgi:acetoacetate decarboxylase